MELKGMNSNCPNRKSNRLLSHDYGSKGLYFVTICTKNRKCCLGSIKDSKHILSEYGEFARTCWLQIPDFYKHVVLHDFVIMPNHVHGILELKEILNSQGDVQNFYHAMGQSPKRTIGSIVRGFKVGVMKQIKKYYSQFYPYDKTIWQSNYHDHIIKSDREYENISQYIINNPALWNRDKFFVNR